MVASLSSAPVSLDPVTASSYAEIALEGYLYDGLYRAGSDGKIVPDLAEGPPAFSADGKTARVPVRRGVKFSDGTELHAADVVASLRRAAGAPAAAWALAPVAAIARDDETVVLTLRRGAPDLAALLAAPQLAVTPSGKSPGAQPIGSGPFRLRSISYDTRTIELDAFDDCFAGRPWIDGIELRWFEDPGDEPRAYEAGAADVSLRGAVAFAGHSPKYPTVTVESGPTVLVYVGFGRAHADLEASQDFRRGVSLAIDRAAFVHEGAGEAVTPALAPDANGPAPPTPQPDEARAALARAPRVDGALEVIVDRTRLDDGDVASRIVAALDRLGIAASYTALEPREYARRIAAGEYDLAIGQLVAPGADPLHEVAAAFAAGGDGWAEGALAGGPLQRKQAWAAFADRLPIVPLYHHGVRVDHKKTLRELVFDRLGRIDLADAFVVGESP